MSRTYRFKKNVMPKHWWFEWDLWVEAEPDWDGPVDYSWYHPRRRLQPHEKEYKRQLARHHRDQWVSFKEPGPHWFRNLFTDRPLRRDSKRELQKFMLDPDYEPIIESKGKLEYWT